MSAIIFRTGYWSLGLVFVLYIMTETMSESPLARVLSDGLLLILAEVALGILALGLIVRLVENARSRAKNRCKVCNVKIPPKSIYCRNHLNEVLEEEDLRHRTMNTRLPD